MILSKKGALFISVCILLSACVTTQRTDLFFGTDIPGGGHVSEQQWKKFSDSVIATRFPEGYTEWEANGRWLDRETKQTISERTKVVTLIGRKSKMRNRALDTVTHAYITQFKQQAVLRVSSKVSSHIITPQQK